MQKRNCASADSSYHDDGLEAGVLRVLVDAGGLLHAQDVDLDLAATGLEHERLAQLVIGGAVGHREDGLGPEGPRPVVGHLAVDAELLVQVDLMVAA